MSNNLVKLIEAPAISTDGTLVQLQSPDIPFEIKRVYYISGVSVGAVRGAHTHKETIQILFCIQGSIIIAFVVSFLMYKYVLPIILKNSFYQKIKK